MVPFPAVEYIAKAIAQIDWQYVTLSRLRYRHRYRPVRVGGFRWHERPFAYEIYHQLRCIWDRRKLDAYCVIHAEVLKRYQEIRHIRKMPDILLHGPDSEDNFAIVEIKLASNKNKSLKKDLDKLVLFQRVLRYETLVEVLIGTNAELSSWNRRFDAQSFQTGRVIDIIFLSLESHRTAIRQIGHAGPNRRR